MKRLDRWMAHCATCLFLTSMTLNAGAQAIEQYTYAPDAIYPVRAGLGITTEIVLDPHEKITDYSTGLSNGWDLTRRGNIFYLRPKNVDVATNMLVHTEAHAYIFELKVVATDWKTLAQAKREGVEYKITFKYPADASFAKETVQPSDAPSLNTALLPSRSYDFNYDYAAKRGTPPWLIPVNVYDDGHFTYIKLSDSARFPTGDFPAVFMREQAHAQDSLVNTTVQGNTIIVHGTYPYLVIRQGNNVVGLRRGAQP